LFRFLLSWHPLRGMLLFWKNQRGVFARKNAEIPLYHTAALFVKQNFAQNFNQKIPEISAKLPLDF